MEKPQFPMGINKYLAHTNVSTRRGGDELVKAGQVFINGKKAVFSDKVTEKDKVEVRNGKIQKKIYAYYAYNKPRGIITHSPQKGEKGVAQTIPLKDVFPIGRLDKDSEGLLILTNDGRITDKLLNPEYVHEKEYRVRTKSKLRANFKERMEGGVNIEGYVTKPCKVKIVGEKEFIITLSEGKKHQIRRMVVALFNEVVTIKRLRIMNISLAGLKEGQCRPIEGAELASFLKALGM